MKTRYKITIIAVCAYFGIFLGPVTASNVYCDFIVQEMCTSRITGVNLPPFNMIPLSLPNDNECFFENAEGVMEPCYNKVGYFEWPFPPRIYEYEHDLRCDEICIDDEIKPSLEQLQFVLDYCNDMSEMKNAIGYEYFNDTHYINNNLCKWQKLTKFPNSDEYCIHGQNMWTNVEEIRNYMHIYNKDKCLWEKEFSWTAEYGKSDPTVMILPGAVIEGNESLDPKVITVVLGINNTVTWINADDTAHGITSNDGSDGAWGTSEVLKPGEIYSHTFNESGIFFYHGTPHPWMTGTVIVLEE